MRERAPQLMVKEELSANFDAWEIAVRFLNGLPDVESLTIHTEWYGSYLMMQCEKKLRSMTSANLLVLGTCEGCGYQF